MDEESPGENPEEVGDLLFSLMNLARSEELHPKEAIHRAAEEFQMV